MNIIGIIKRLSLWCDGEVGEGEAGMEGEDVDIPCKEVEICESEK